MELPEDEATPHDAGAEDNSNAETVDNSGEASPSGNPLPNGEPPALFDEPATAELVDDVVDAELASPSLEVGLDDAASPFDDAVAPVKLSDETLIPRNIQAKGGAVGSFVVGLLAFFGSFITSYSVINAVIGLLLGIWGLSSRHRRLAVVGMVLSMVGLLFSAVQITELIQWYLQVRAESAEVDF